MFDVMNILHLRIICVGMHFLHNFKERGDFLIKKWLFGFEMPFEEKKKYPHHMLLLMHKSIFAQLFGIVYIFVEYFIVVIVLIQLLLNILGVGGFFFGFF